MTYDEADAAAYAMARGAAMVTGQAIESNGMVPLGPVIEIVRDFGEVLKPEYRVLFDMHLAELKQEAIDAQERMNN